MPISSRFIGDRRRWLPPGVKDATYWESGVLECKNGFTYHPRERFLDMPCGEIDDFVNTLRHIVKTVKTNQNRQKQGEKAMKNINLKQIIDNATPDMDGSYEEQLAYWNAKLSEKSAKLEKLREEVKTATQHTQWYISTISKTMHDIQVIKGEIIRTLIDFNGSFAHDFFELVEA